ncbi:hypothetical protein [Kordia jejudonensis]|uniref:hypothetical protein n=1 Tax=Kordia jejudonensis TaxID=1348245 RepID=UPI0006292A4D|nr:hypothetical protein [Kordia jejudonensis]
MEQTILLDAYTAFMESSKETSSLVDTNTDELPILFRNFKYPISAYPILVTKAQNQKLEEISTLIPELLQRAPKLYFQNDVKKIADFYFDGDEMIAQFAIMCQEREVPVSCRLDLSLTTDGFKVLEVNMGSAIGGIGLQNFAPIIRKTHAVLSNETPGKQFKFIQSQDLYIKFIAQQMLAYTQTKSPEINLFLVADAESEKANNELITSFFDTLLKKELKRKGKRGNVYMNTIASLKMRADGLYFKEKQVHGVLILDFSLRDISPDLFRGFIMNNVYFPDHLGVMYVRDKRNLALMRRLANEGKYTEKENKLILECIPWTEIVTNATVTFQGKTHNIITLLKTQKDQFVVKIIDGLQGKDVFVGKFMTNADWETAIDEAVKSGKYIAQEFSDSLNLIAPTKEGDWVPQKLVWGSFGFGDIYGGSWVRMSPVKTTSGVINSATGAVEALVFEYDATLS